MLPNTPRSTRSTARRTCEQFAASARFAITAARLQRKIPKNPALRAQHFIYARVPQLRPSVQIREAHDGLAPSHAQQSSASLAP
jgi:hypothetical protein